MEDERKRFSLRSAGPDRKSLERSSLVGSIRKSVSSVSLIRFRSPLISLLKEKTSQTTDVEVSKLLSRSSPINVNEEGDYGVTALMLATRYNCHPQVLLAIIKAGANVNQKNLIGQTALFYAVTTSGVLTELLIENGANINCTDQLTGRTPLMEAAGYCDDFNIVKTLIKAGASLKFVDGKGRTAADFAEARNKLDEFIKCTNGLSMEEIPFGEKKTEMGEEYRKNVNFNKNDDNNKRKSVKKFIIKTEQDSSEANIPPPISPVTSSSRPRVQYVNFSMGNRPVSSTKPYHQPEYPIKG